MPLPIGHDGACGSGDLPADAIQAWAACTSELLVLTGDEGRLLWCNPPFERLTARVLPELIGEPLWTLLAATAAHASSWQGFTDKLACNAAIDPVEIEVQTADGAKRWLRAVPNRLGAPDTGSGMRQLCVLSDLTEHRQHAAQAVQLAELLATLQSFGRLGVWERDLRTGAGRWDPEVFRLYGFDPADGVPALGLAVSRIHPEDRTQFRYGDLNALPGRHDRRYRLMHPDGRMRWLASHWEVKTGADGSPERAIGILIDDTDAYELAQALGSTSVQLKLAIELGNIALWRHDLHTDRISCNERAHHVFGLPEGIVDLPLATMRSSLHPEDVQRVTAAAAQALSSDQPTDIEARFKGAEGRWRSLMTRRVVERAADGTPVAFVGIALDVTRHAEERRLAIEQLRRLEAAVAAVGVGAWSFDPVTREAEWSAQVFALVGRDPASGPPSLGELKHQIIHAGDWADIEAAMTALVSSAKGTLVHSFRVRLPSGETRWLEDRARRETQDGKVLLSGVAFDVTDRRRTEAALRSADERAALATRSAGIGTWEMSLVDDDERWDEQMFRLRGLTPREHPPARAERLAGVHPDDRAQLIDSIPDLKNDRSTAKYQFRVRLPDGSERWIASRSIAVLDDSGRPIRRVGVNWDITENRLAEAAREASALAQRESLAKSQFLSRVSHELRTPLNAVLGFAQLMQAEESLADGHKARLALISSAGEHLLLLINDMLDLTGLDTGELKLDPRPVALAELVRETMPLVESLAAQQRVTLHSSHLEGVVLADRTRLRQVLINLLTNAIKYNRPQGRVALSVRVAQEQLTLEIEDTGRGLTPAQIAHLFEPFNRLGAESEGIEGSGIGLVIVKALVERMGGRVEVSSTRERGTTFSVTLPAVTADTPPSPGSAPTPSLAPLGHATTSGASPRSGAPAAKARSGRVLYIEDNAVNMLLVQEIVALRPGLAMLCATDGAQGVQLALAHRPELVLIDMQLPDFDGFEVLRRLRADPAGAALRCVALSANALPEDIARARAAGFADYWTKPIDFKRFLAGLDAAFADEAAGI